MRVSTSLTANSHGDRFSHCVCEKTASSPCDGSQLNRIFHISGVVFDADVGEMLGDKRKSQELALMASSNALDGRYLGEGFHFFQCSFPALDYDRALTDSRRLSQFVTEHDFVNT